MGKYSVNKKTGLNYRPDTGDSDMFKEACEYKEIFKICKDKVVLDIGSNIGMFTYNAIKSGAKQVIAYEPEKENFEVFSSQPFNGPNVIAKNIAIAEEDGEVEFYVSKKKEGKRTCMGRHSIIPTRGRIKVKVPTIDWKKEIKKYNPSVIKIDTEGAELFLDWENLPKSIEYLAIEIHARGNEEKADKLLEWVLNNFEALYRKDTTFFGKKDTYIIAGKRK